MVFSSILFLLYFFPITIIGHSLLEKTKLKNYFLLLVSCLFYFWGAPKFIFLLMLSTVVDFFLIRKISTSTSPGKKKKTLVISIGLNLGLLVYFKYFNFFIHSINELTGLSFDFWKIALPIGISFYTFQSISCAVDVYRGTVKPLNKLSDYLLYILLFPQMIAGPIVRFGTIRNQIENRILNPDQKLLGLYRFIIGLAKKVLIANVLGAFAATILKEDLTSFSSLELWLALIAYSFQIYFDFSGYSDMAIGIGKMLGFTFPENFNLPYISKSITEFWKRWHITLGAFMRDYLYIPLGGNRKGRYRTLFNLCFVFFLSGLWHGASFNFILWGLFHGFFLILDRLFLKKALNKIGVLAIPVTYFIVVQGWGIFYLNNPQDIFTLFKEIYQISDWSFNIKVSNEVFYTLIFAGLFSFFGLIPTIEKRVKAFINIRVISLYSHLIVLPILLITCIVCISSIASEGFNPFIYYRF